MVKYRYLGNSGLKVNEIIYGNWLTHGSQVEKKTALACVKAALDAGITTFDTADVYAEGRAEEVLGSALAGQRRESLVVLTKVYWPMPPKGPNDCGLSRKHILESIDSSLRRLNMDYVDVYQAHRFDTETPLEETMRAFADVVRAGKAHYIGVSEWSADQIRSAHTLASDLGIQLVSNQPQYSMLWRVIEGEIVPACQELGVSQIVFSPIAQGVLTGKYRPGKAAPKGSRATDTKGGGKFVRQFTDDKELLTRVQGLAPIAKELGVTMSQLALAWVLGRPNIAAAIMGASRPEQVSENVKASGLHIPAELYARIDAVLAGSYEQDPGLTLEGAPQQRPC